MAKLTLKKAATDVTVYLFAQNSSVTTGAGLTGLAYNTASLTAYYVRPLGSAAAITLATQTVEGAHSDGGFIEVDATNMPGVYRLDLPDAVCATGVPSAIVMLKGAANLAPVLLEIQLTDFDLNTDGVKIGATQGAITWGQQKIIADVADEGALDIYNSNSDGVGQQNHGLKIGLLNFGASTFGMRNVSSGGMGQNNGGASGGVYNQGAFGTKNEGGIGVHNVGTDTAGVHNEGYTIGEYNVSEDGIGQLNAGGTKAVDGFDPALALEATLTGNYNEMTDGNGVVVKQINSNVITANAVKADAVTKIQANLALEATLTAIKGDGWTTETLAALDALIDAIKAKTDTIAAAPTAASVADAVLAEVVEGSLDVKEVARIILAATAGKSSGGGTSAIKFRDVADGLDRISATVDANGNRSAITLNGGDS